MRRFAYPLATLISIGLAIPAVYAAPVASDSVSRYVSTQAAADQFSAQSKSKKKMQKKQPAGGKETTGSGSSAWGG